MITLILWQYSRELVPIGLLSQLNFVTLLRVLQFVSVRMIRVRALEQRMVLHNLLAEEMPSCICVTSGHDGLLAAEAFSQRAGIVLELLEETTLIRVGSILR